MYVDGKKFENINFLEFPLEKGEYEDCSFINCNFSSADLNAIVLINSNFEGCDLSMASVKDTALREVSFNNCKMLGLHFEDCNSFLFEVYFNNCQLDLSSFYQRILKNSKFKTCSLKEVDFVEADLTNVVFFECNLENAVFEHSILSGTDFRNASLYRLDPDINKISKAKFSKDGLAGLLLKYEIIIE